MSTEFTKREKAQLRQLASEAWEAELSIELEKLFEEFCTWTENGMSAFDLNELIHEFHNGASRDLFKRYSILPPEIAVARAIALDITSEESINAQLLESLQPLVEVHRRWEEQ